MKCATHAITVNTLLLLVQCSSFNRVCARVRAYLVIMQVALCVLMPMKVNCCRDVYITALSSLSNLFFNDTNKTLSMHIYQKH